MQPKGRGDTGFPSRMARIADVARLQFGHSQKGRGEPHSVRQLELPQPHCFNSATAKRPWRTIALVALPQGCTLLQFGHSQKAVENRRWRRRPRKTRPMCFNSATAKRPWRTWSKEYASSGRRRLSIRPQPKGRGETPPVDQSVLRPDRASIRPQPKGRGEPRRPTDDWLREDAFRFNSATAKRPWRTLPIPLTPTLLFVASCFNSATAKRPWRTLLPCLPFLEPVHGYRHPKGTHPRRRDRQVKWTHPSHSDPFQ